jgi:chorismate synthase
LVARVAFKPASSIAREQRTVDLRTLEPATLKVKGRHDPCIVPRAVPVVEACMAFTLADLAMLAGDLPRGGVGARGGEGAPPGERGGPRG